jgi:hypothetical protein
MFLFLENLVKTEIDKEELFLIPYPRYIKVENFQKLRITEQTRIVTDLTIEHSFIIDQF